MKQLELFKEKGIDSFYASLKRYIVVYAVTLVIWCTVLHSSALYFYNLPPIGWSMLVLLGRVSSFAIMDKMLFIGLIFLTPLIPTLIMIKNSRSCEND